MNITSYYIIFGLLSVIAMAFPFFLIVHQKKKRVISGNKITTTPMLFAEGTFFAAVLMFLPLYRYNPLDGALTWAAALPSSIHSAMRLFILDGDISFMLTRVVTSGEAFSIAIKAYFCLLYLFAPVLTFAAVLSLFRGLVSEFRYAFRGKKTVYAMSALNEKSLALAKSICKDPKKRNGIIVFTEVFEHNEECSYEYVNEARGLGAICFRKDITSLCITRKPCLLKRLWCGIFSKGDAPQRFGKKKDCDVEIFLIGEDESENLSQAISITQRLNSEHNRQNIKLFVFAVSESSAYIIDSIQYDDLLAYSESRNYLEGFTLRRVDDIKQLVWKTVSSDMRYDIIRAAKRSREAASAGETPVISVTIAGMGSYGLEFLKMLVWYCQFEGFKLEVNLFDKQQGGENGSVGIRAMIGRYCPELLRKNGNTESGDAVYDIKCYEGIDFNGNELERLFAEDSADRERLLRTALIVVSLGSDDKNIATSVYLRSFFDRLRGTVAEQQMQMDSEFPSIYAIVHNGKKSGVVNGNRLINHKLIPYNIKFIGSIDEQYSYDKIYDFALEVEARKRHMKWTINARRAYEELKSRRPYEDIIFSMLGGDLFEKEDAPEATDEELRKYERFEYYRNSSVAKALYDAVLDDPFFEGEYTCKADGERLICTCENCVRRKRQEHSRWVAYMRTEGFSFGMRADRAKTHDKMCDWTRLDDWDRVKDN